MTTGRINQVATIRVVMFRILLPNIRSSLGKCGIWIASLHKFRNCLVPLLRSGVCVVPDREATPPEKRAQLHQRHEVQPLLGNTAKLRY